MAYRFSSEAYQLSNSNTKPNLEQLKALFLEPGPTPELPPYTMQSIQAVTCVYQICP